MRIRTNKALKFFALLLFSLEVLAPTMLIDVAVPEVCQDKIQLMDGAHHQNMFCSIITEEMTENEEGREGHRDILCTDFSFAFTLLELLGSESTSSRYSSLLSKRFETQPALFKLNCTFRI